MRAARCDGSKQAKPDRTTIEFQPGGHRIFGKGTFEFLQTHLHYP